LDIDQWQSYNKIDQYASPTWNFVLAAESQPFETFADGNGRSEILHLQRSFSSKERTLDPFSSASIPITEGVHHLLTYFEKLFCKRCVKPSFQSWNSASSQVVRDCVFDEVQMRCILAAMAARREYFDGDVITESSTKHFNLAMTAMRRRLSTSTVVETKLIYAMMKLCHAEGYRRNFEAGIIHLLGARAALQQLGSWKDLEIEYVPTFCGSGHAFMASRVWRRPASFPCLVDPGRAISCFDSDLVDQFVCGNPLGNGNGQMLLVAIASSVRDLQTVPVLQQLVSDLVEYSIVKNTTLLFEQANLPIPELVVRWIHLRRYGLLSRLLSVAIFESDFLHAIRVSLILWLSIVADYKGTAGDLEIVASHLQDVVIQLLPCGENGCPDVFMWMLMLGSVAGGARYVKPWFITQISTLSKSMKGYAEKSVEQWYTGLELVNRETVYCDGIQRDGLADIAYQLSHVSAK
jgi:hypothetical protein